MRHHVARKGTALLVGLATALLEVTVLAPGASAGEGDPEPVTVVNVEPPTIEGDAVFDSRLRAGPGEWLPPDVTFDYSWLRDGKRIRGATAKSYKLGLVDLQARISVRVTATAETGERGRATSEETERVGRATMANTKAPRVSGTWRYTRSVEASPGRWSKRSAKVRYQWFRGEKAIAGAQRQRYSFAPEDVGRRLAVRVTASAPGYTSAVKRSKAQVVKHRVDVRRRVTYHVETRGRITANLKAFRAQAKETYNDPRGWRGGGVEFRQVSSGGSFTLVLAAASSVPAFSSGCSSQWSCRVGRYVIINQERWKHASPAWNAAKGTTLRGYRHMVVNHETGHWLGRGHAGCPGNGRLAPVMMQQSKGLGGCRFNPWPTLGEQGG